MIIQLKYQIMSKSQTEVFIVDDEPLLTKMLGDYLREKDSSLSVKSFPTGEACLQSLDQNPDIVVLDYYLNSKERAAANGIDILKAIRDKNKTLPVVMLSSQKSYSTAAKTIMHGAVHYVIKGQDAFEEIYKLIKANV
jgi:DNA-binding NarL/FixJ family response regulator